VVNVGTYTATGTEQYLGVTFAGSVVINLAAPTTNQTVIIKDERGTASTQSIVVIPSSGITIDGQSTLVISTNYGHATIWFNTRWHIIG
jgi:hypothetical protein